MKLRRSGACRRGIQSRYSVEVFGYQFPGAFDRAHLEEKKIPFPGFCRSHLEEEVALPDHEMEFSIGGLDGIGGRSGKITCLRVQDFKVL